MNPRKPISIDTGNAVVRELGAADGGGAGELTSAETASTMLATVTQMTKIAASFWFWKVIFCINC